MGKIVYYTLSGDFDHDETLNAENLGHTNGMMLKCYLKDHSELVGYADPFRIHDSGKYDNEVHDYIYLWTWDQSIFYRKHLKEWTCLCKCRRR